MTGWDDRELLRHHGDVEADPALLDFAVNVRSRRPPFWLRERLAAALDRLGSYPSEADERAARGAVAERHGRRGGEVLPLAGAAECFARLPALRPRLAAVIHPSFTEPEVALRDADVPVTRVHLSASEGYRLQPDRVPEEADLVVLGNPTNPTSRLHPRDAVRALVRPGRVVVVDEAFSDAVPGEPESLAECSLPGVLVVRSLTKTWALAGLRVGYALGDSELLARLSVGRPHWPLNTLALESLVACSRPEALKEAADAASEIAGHREAFIGELAGIPGVHVHRPAHAPFLLLRIDDGSQVRTELRARGFAVRRADTFPGLGREHIRVAVRSPELNTRLARTLRDVRSTLAGVSV